MGWVEEEESILSGTRRLRPERAEEATSVTIHYWSSKTKAADIAMSPQ